MTRFEVQTPARGLCAALTAAVMGAVLFATPAEAARTSLAGLLARLAALEGTVAELKNANTQQQDDIAELRADLAAEAAARQAADDALQALLDALSGDSLPVIKAAVDALQEDVAELQMHSVPGLANYVEVIELLRDLDGFGPEPVPTVRFEGANVQIVDGTGSTIPAAGRPSGLGNLIVGYDETNPGGDEHCSDGQFTTLLTCVGAGEVWAANQKNGAHNLVVGPFHFYSQAGGVVFGQGNVISGPSAVVSGGTGNNASGSWASVSGGSFNTASGEESSVSGGLFNTASGGNSSVSGGSDNTASGGVSSVSGGQDNTASGITASVSGGFDNTASGSRASVSGGQENTAEGPHSSISGGLRNTSDGLASSISGGSFNTASGRASSVSGGQQNNAFSDQSTVSGGFARSVDDDFDWAAGSLLEDF